METIAERSLLSYLDCTGLAENDEPTSVRCSQVRKNKGHKVSSYLDLAMKVASVQYHNPDYVFLFRGQPHDYRRRSASSLKPPIFRGPKTAPAHKQDVPSLATMQQRYERLHYAEQLLMNLYPHQTGRSKLARQRILRWSILQHYEVCDTPLLDVTHSLRVAASFASLAGTEEAFVYMLGVPNISASITASSEAGLQIVRLASVCPPEARRPHIQEGYLLGEYPDIPEVAQKALYGAYEVDFGRRMAAKFRFEPKIFWKLSDTFPQISENALYPAVSDDPLLAVCTSIRTQVNQEVA